MTSRNTTRLSLSFAAMLMASTAPALAQDVQIVQPGAPGEGSRTLSAEEARNLARNDISAADISFMRNMIVHHQQAVEMSALVADRTNNETIISVSERIDASQEDEITFMREWLADRGQTSTMGAMGHAEHSGMAGMASAEDMARLAASRGVNFDRLFLTLMTRHHQGAIEMVRDLMRIGGTAADPAFYEFTNEIVNDQTAEITRMVAALTELSEDPRAGLAGGFLDAEYAISNLRQVAFLPKPDGFFDPANPSGGRVSHSRRRTRRSSRRRRA